MRKHTSCILVCVCVCVREGVLPIMASTGKLRPKGVPPFSGFRHMKGYGFHVFKHI